MWFDILIIGIGLGAILIAIFEKRYDYLSRSRGEVIRTPKRVPLWFGRLAFSLFGVLLLGFGFFLLFGDARHPN